MGQVCFHVAVTHVSCVFSCRCEAWIRRVFVSLWAWPIAQLCYTGRSRKNWVPNLRRYHFFCSCVPQRGSYLVEKIRQFLLWHFLSRATWSTNLKRLRLRLRSGNIDSNSDSASTLALQEIFHPRDPKKRCDVANFLDFLFDCIQTGDTAISYPFALTVVTAGLGYL